MMFRQYTSCYTHVPPDKPFNKADLLGFVTGNAGPGGIAMIAAFLAGMPVIAFVILAIQTAITIVAVANEWLNHRLVCIPGAEASVCAVGIVLANPTTGDLGQFDNDQYFTMRLMPHAPAPDAADGVATAHYVDDVGGDGFQGAQLLKPVAWDLPYLDAAQGGERAGLHCEAEGNFWQAMKDYAPIAGIATAVGAAVGAGAGAAIGCAIGGLFGPIGCAIGALVGAIAGALGGAAGAAAIVATIAFHSDPGNVDDTNVGDRSLEPIQAGDRIVAVGHHVYDGFHEGWHEFHPLMMVMKIPEYFEQGTGLPATPALNAGQADADIALGLTAPPFRAAAANLKDRWCSAVRATLDPGLRPQQQQPQNGWTIHPDVDGCMPPEPDPPPIR